MREDLAAPFVVQLVGRSVGSEIKLQVPTIAQHYSRKS